MRIPYAEVIGDPIAHSKSPLIHKFWLRKLGVEADYRSTRVTPDDLPDFLEARRQDPFWLGCNLTMPLKRQVLDFVTPLHHRLAAIGAANVVVARGDTLFGANTDTNGMLEALNGSNTEGPLAALIGAGGAARAAAATLATHVPQLVVINRTLGHAEKMVEELGIEADVRGLDAPLPPAGLLVNATPLGMRGYPEMPVSLAPLPAHAVVMDLVYDPLETPLLAAARAAGLRTMDGLVMLIGQAAAAFAMLFGRAPPRAHDDELRALLTS